MRLRGSLSLALLLAACGGPSVPPPVELAPPLPASAAPAPPEPQAHTPPPPRPPPPPTAEPVATGDRARAQKLFEEGGALFAAGDYAGACVKFDESYAAEPALGTLFNRATCREKLGDKPAACRLYADAAAQARANGQTERAKVAEDRRRNLCP